MATTGKNQIDESRRELDRQALVGLAADNPDLERLEALLDQFNLFEMLGTVRHELSHSRVLAFLLNPRRPHGLGDAFAKEFVKRALSAASSKTADTLKLRDIEAWDLGKLVVRREHQHIDILLIDERHKLVVIIENKIDSNEHSDQLARYRDLAEHRYPGWQYLFLFLTPDGRSPSDPAYIPVSYHTICLSLERVAVTRSSSLAPDVMTLLEHYTGMLRRHLMDESEIADLCRRIYRNHRRALDLIYTYRERQGDPLREAFKHLVKAGGLLEDYHAPRYYRFFSPVWDRIEELAKGGSWTKSGRMLLLEAYEAHEEPSGLYVKLAFGPGPDTIQQRLARMAKTYGPPFLQDLPEGVERWNPLYLRRLVPFEDYIEAPSHQVLDILQGPWQSFVDIDLPQLNQAVAQEFAGE